MLPDQTAPKTISSQLEPNTQKSTMPSSDPHPSVITLSQPPKISDTLAIQKKEAYEDCTPCRLMGKLCPISLQTSLQISLPTPEYHPIHILHNITYPDEYIHCRQRSIHRSRHLQLRIRHVATQRAGSGDIEERVEGYDAGEAVGDFWVEWGVGWVGGLSVG